MPLSLRDGFLRGVIIRQPCQCPDWSTLQNGKIFWNYWEWQQKNALAGLGRKKLVIKINFHQFGPKVFDSLTLNIFFEKQVFTIFPQCVNRLPFHTQPSDAKKETIFGCTLSIFRYPCYYFLTTKYSALNLFVWTRIMYFPFSQFSCSRSTVYHPHRFAWWPYKIHILYFTENKTKYFGSSSLT